MYKKGIKVYIFKDLKAIVMCLVLVGIFAFCQDKEQISFEKIMIDRVKYNLERVDLIAKTFSKFFTQSKNMDILKYAICKYLLPRYLYTNSLQLLLHLSVLNLEKKCPECMLRFYRTVKETPDDFQWLTKIFNFVEKFADYKLKIQALQTFLYQVDLYSQDLMKIYLENNREKLVDYIILLEEQIISIFTESFVKWDQNKKECEIAYNKDMFFDKCFSGKKVPIIDKGDTNCGCDNRIPLQAKDYFNAVAYYPLDSIFHLNVMYSHHYSAKLKEALNFHYTFRKYIESNFINFYALVKTSIDENEKIIYELCIQQCKNPITITPNEYCMSITDQRECEEKGCFWCEKLKKCALTKNYCNPFICKNKQDFILSKRRVCESQEGGGLPYIDKVDGAYLACKNYTFSFDEILKLCKKFRSVYVCQYIWIHKIGDTEYDMHYGDCFLYNICKCFDEEQISSAKDDIELPKCDPLLPR